MDLGSSYKKPFKNQTDRFPYIRVLFFEKISLRFLKKCFLLCGFLLYASVLFFFIETSYSSFDFLQRIKATLV